MTPVSEAKKGEYVRVDSIDAGIGLRSRLHALGISVGNVLEVVQNSGVGPLILKVKGSNIALGRGQGYWVEEPTAKDN